MHQTQRLKRLANSKMGKAISTVFLLFILLLILGINVNAVPANPEPFEFAQPNGQNLTVFNRGDEFLNWSESADGSLIVKEGDAYYYADWTDSGPKATATLASNNPNSQTKSKGRDIPASVRYAADGQIIQNVALMESIRRNAAQLQSNATDLNEAPSPAVNPSPQRKVLMIYATYNSDPMVGSNLRSSLKMTPQQVNSLVFGCADSGSVNDYYMKLLETNSNVIIPATGSGISTPGVITVNLAGYHPNPGNGSGQSGMMSAALNAAISQGLKLTEFTGGSTTLTTDMLSIGVLFQGYESSYGGLDYGFWGTSGYGGTYGGINLQSMFGQGTIHGDHLLTPGIICHELGYSGYGFADTYDYNSYVSDGTCMGMGNWSLMAHGSWGCKSGESSGKTPAFVDAYNLVISGLVIPETINYNQNTTNTIGNQTQVYKIMPQGTASDTSQYFLLQQRMYAGYDAGCFFQIGASANSGGLLIYHIDPSVTTHNDKNTHLLAGIEEAHGGTQRLQQPSGGDYGNATDLFGNGKSQFSMATDPSSGLYSAFTLNTLPPTQTVNSGIDIRNISYSSGRTTFTMYSSVTPTPSPIPTATPTSTPTPTPWPTPTPTPLPPTPTSTPTPTPAPPGKTFEETFPDPNFCAAVLELLNADGGMRTSGSAVTGADQTSMAAYTYLDVSSRGISDLAGIEYFNTLEYLYCNNNLLTALDVSNNAELIYLDCDGNRLPELDLSNTTLLEHLDCRSNQLTELDVSNSTALSFLHCGSNKLTELDVSANSELGYLICYENYMVSPDSVKGWQELGLVINSPSATDSGTFLFYNQQTQFPDVIYGDVYGDGIVDDLDHLMLTQYINGWLVQISAGADVNGDGVVDDIDHLILTQYINGWPVVLGPQTSESPPLLMGNGINPVS